MVSLPTRVARMIRRPEVLMVAPVTPEPGDTSTGTDSPVSSEASTALWPSTTTPSVAIFSPGRTTNSSLGMRVPAGSVTSVRTPSTVRSTVASLAPRLSNEWSAFPARCLALASRKRPSRRKVVTTAATSKYRAWPPIIMPGCWVASGSAVSCHAENAKAAVTPIDTSVSMVDEKCRAFTSAARWKGHADHATTGRASARTTHPQCGNWRAGIIEMSTTGSVSTAATIRRDRSRGAACASSCAASLCP